MNKVILMGRLTRDPEVRYTQGENSLCIANFTVAVDRGITNAKGEKLTDFINCVAWDKTAEFVCKYFAKGAMICVEGSIQTRQYLDNSGRNRYVTEVNAQNVHFTGEKRDVITDAPTEQAPATDTTAAAQFGSQPDMSIYDADCPF